MMDFREIARNIWNTHLRFAHPNNPIERSFSFDKIIRELFSCLISSMNFLENERGDYGASPSPIFLKPKPHAKETYARFSSLDPNENLVWSDYKIISATTMDNWKFFDFFDWNALGCIDMYYTRAYISPVDFALIPNHQIDFILKD